MNNSLYNKIITSVSKVVKKSINEAYDTSIYDNWYESFDELSILNSAGKIGDILQINQYDEYIVKPGNLVNESMFDDIDFDDDYSVSVSDKLNNWKDLAICFGEGLWVYLDWVGFNKDLYWAQAQGITRLYKNQIPDINGYENTQYILNNYKIKGTIWEEVQNCKYNVYIPDKKQLEIIYDVNEKYKLSRFGGYHWTSSEDTAYCWGDSGYCNAFIVNFNNGDVDKDDKTFDDRSVALLHF